MSLKLRPYPDYRDSGLSSLGEIPAHWEVERLKRVARINPSKAEAREVLDRGDGVTFLPMEKVGSNGEINAGEVVPAASVWNDFTYFRRSDVLVAKITPCFENGKGACLDSLPTPVGFGSTEFIVMRANNGLAPQYLYRVTTLAEFRALGADAMTGSAGQQRVPSEFVRDFASAVPPLSEQDAIVRFLNFADGLVDRIIRAKQRLIELLDEQKQAVIHRAVTRGLNPDVPMKTTGLDWLPEVPENWDVGKLKGLAKVQTGVTLGKHHSDAHLEERPYLRVANVQAGYLDLSEVTTLRLPRQEAIRFQLQPGDVLMTEGGDIDKLGRGAIWNNEIAGCLHQNHIFAVRPRNERLRSEFLVYVMSSPVGRIYFEKTAKKTTNLASTNSTTLKAFSVPIPSVEEQDSILRTIELEAGIVDAAIQRARREIDLIREYRTRLISDVVTGKLDVREKTVAAQPKKANVHFQRSVLAAEIVDQYQGMPKFGRTKLQKAVILAERHLRMDEIQSKPRRAAAGPFDNPMMQSIHAQLERQKWFQPKKSHGGRYEYIPLEKRGGHRRYFDRYWGSKREAFDHLLTLLKPMSTDQTEIVATLYMAWNDFLIRGEQVDDDRLVHEVLHHWDESKRRFSEDRWHNAISWMRKHHLVPQGFGTTTVGSIDVTN